MRELRNKRYFIYGAVVGILIFLAIYGVAVLDVKADGWIFKSDVDLRQHYLGWMAYRDSRLSIPTGMTDKLSYPHEMSIVYTDSIPLLAFVFKCLSPFLPRPFQYFGWYALICFALTGAFAAACISCLVKNKPVIAVSTFFCVLSYPLLFRTFYHTSLSSQWLILLCFYLVLSGGLEKSLHRQMKNALWVGELCAGIHLYFFPMAMAVLIAGYLRRLIVSSASERTGVIREAAAAVCSMCLGAAFVLWLMGALNFPSGNGNYWVGDFTMNLNSLINSLGHSAFLPALPLYSPMQFEGAVYPGLGVLVLAVFCLIWGVSRMIIRKGPDPENTGLSAGKFKDESGTLSVIKRHPLRFSFGVMAVILMILSVSPVFAFGDRLILSLPYPEALSRVLGVFRSNGRFIWPVLYLMIFLLVKCADGIMNKEAPAVHKKAVSVLLLGCLVLQVVDFSGWIGEKQKKYYTAQKTYRTVWDELALPDEVWDRYDGFVIYEDDTGFNMGTTYFAMRHEMTVNTFYFARDIDEKIEQTREEYTAELLSGGADPSKVYVLDRDSYERFKDTGLHFYKTRKCAFGVADAIEGLEELKDEDLDEISWQ